MMKTLRIVCHVTSPWSLTKVAHRFSYPVSRRCSQNEPLHPSYAFGDHDDDRRSLGILQIVAAQIVSIYTIALAQILLPKPGFFRGGGWFPTHLVLSRFPCN